MSKQLKISAFFKMPGDASTQQESKGIRKYSPEDFVDDHEGKRKISNPNGDEKVVRKCPFYKRITGTNFVVDAFSYGEIEGVSRYFLSHYHYDHYMGLRKSFKGSLVCSPITAKLVQAVIGVSPEQILTIECDTPTMVDGVKVVLIDANHCPGAVLFLFIFPNGKRILHTGDFRASPKMEEDPFLTEAPIEQVYLDTTYCNPNYDFPPQKDTLNAILNITIDHLKRDANTLFVCGSYSIGKEKVFKCICENLSFRLWVTSQKLKLLKCIDDPVINEHLTLNKDEARVHVLAMGNINHKFLKDYLKGAKERFTSLVAFKPTGWEQDGQPLDRTRPSARENVYIYGIPYSEHSSHKELERFIKFFKFKQITPTVNVGNPATRQKMFKVIASWKNSLREVKPVEKEDDDEVKIASTSG